MRALVLEKPGPIEGGPLQLREVPAPSLRPGHVLVRVEACGVCRTDLHIVEADLNLPRLPLIPGHQIIGRVEALGEGFGHVGRGDRVGIPWLHHTCGGCRFCGKALENLCENADFTGYTVDGGYAELVTAPADFVYPVPEDIPAADLTPLLCAGVIGFRSLRLSGIQPGQRLGFFGFGNSAHIAIQVARHWDCEVYVFTRGRQHRRLAEELGAVWSGDARETPPHKLDAAVVFAPAGWIVLEALRVLEKGGTVSCAGIHMSPIPQMDYQLLYNEHTLRSAANSTRQDVRDLLKLASQIPIRTTVECFPLEQANRALLALAKSEINGAASLMI